MESTKKSTAIDTQNEIYAVLFAGDGKQVLSGDEEGMLRRWRADNGHEVGEPVRVEQGEIYAAALSPNQKWLVCGLNLRGHKQGRVKVWDAQTHEKVYDIKDHTDTVCSVDVSPDSTKFATGSHDQNAFIWDIKTGEKLVGPLQHDGSVVCIRFSPQGDRIVTATALKNPNPKSIRIYDVGAGQLLLDIPSQFPLSPSSWLAWSSDGVHIFAVSWKGQVQRFDTSSGFLLSTWSLPKNGCPASVVLSRNQKFAVVVVYDTVSLWDTSSQQRIGTTIKHASCVYSIALSPSDDCLATGEENGTIILRSLHDILPPAYLTVDVSDYLDNISKSDILALRSLRILPLIRINDIQFKSWMQGDLTRVEALLDADITHPFNPFYHARALAHRSLVRARSRQWVTAVGDATKSMKIQQSTIGRVAHAVALLGTGDHESAMRVFNRAVDEAPPVDKCLLSLIKAVILFSCGRHDGAFSHLDSLIAQVPVPEQSPYVAVGARMHLSFGQLMLGRGEKQRALDSFKQARKAIPVQPDPYLQVISLIFGWDLERLSTETLEGVYTLLQGPGEESLILGVTADWHPDIVEHWVGRLEKDGDAALGSQDPERAIARYSTALSLKRSKPFDLFIKRSYARARLGLWEHVLSDSNEAIKADSSSPWGYERKHAALHALNQYDSAIDAFTRMYSLIEGTHDQGIRQLGEKYISPTQLQRSIDEAVVRLSKSYPLVLIDLKSGRLCDESERSRIFKSEQQFKELFSSMMQKLDNRRIKVVVEDYFRYVTLSHVWNGEEPSYQDVGTVWKLCSSLQNDKLRNFCEEVARNGYRWAWSDTCCIDKTTSTVLNQSLKMMYKWYEASAATYAHLPDVGSPSALGELTDSVWMTRAWTSQELLAPKVVRFYTRDWKPYLGDNRSNHKESPEIMQELADSIKISRSTIVAFNPSDLSNWEKLRLASSRNARREEDVAYSLIGMFKSDIRPEYGERYAALGHLLEEIVARSGDVSVLAWTGKSSPYNTCLPDTLAVYSKPCCTFSAIEDAELDTRVTASKKLLSQASVVPFHERVANLPSARFAHRRLHLPCIIFSVKRLALQDFGHDHEFHYRARVRGVGHIEFQTSEKLPPMEPHKLIFVHPWIRALCDPPNGFVGGSSADDGDDSSDSGVETVGASPTSPLRVAPAPSLDDYTRALRLMARLRRPFHALLLQQQPNGEFQRVAAEHDIIIGHLEEQIDLAKDVGTHVVEIL